MNTLEQRNERFKNKEKVKKKKKFKKNIKKKLIIPIPFEHDSLPYLSIVDSFLSLLMAENMMETRNEKKDYFVEKRYSHRTATCG